MILKRLHTLNFEDNDIYRLEPYHDKIIVNEDCHGIRILDFSLNTIKIIPIVDGLTVDSIYKKFDGSALLIYDFHNGWLALVDLETFNHRVTKIDNHLKGYFQSSNYHWQGDTLIFAMDNNDNFYQFNFTSLALEKISSRKVKSTAPSFFDFCNACRKYKAITIYPDKEAFIFQKNRNLIAFYDYKHKKLVLEKHKVNHFQEIYYHKNSFIFFYSWEKCIALQKNKVFLSSADPNYYCLRMNFLSNDTMIILETNKDDHKFCSLSVYQLIDE